MKPDYRTVQAPENSNTGLFIPDFCNFGIFLRVLVAVNLFVLLSLFAQSEQWQSVLTEFTENSMLVEFICLTSLLLLCAIRRINLHYPLPGWLQRLLCGLIPACVSGLLLGFLGHQEWFVYNFSQFRWISTICLCFCIGMILQHYLELRTKAFSPALVEARLQALQARIRPHFLFNSLNAVLSLIRSEPRRAETALEDLADLFRLLMRDTRDMTSLGEEIKLCQHYLGIEKIRLDQRLMVEWSIQNLSSAELKNITIPSLLLQPLIENAVHYGIEPSTVPALIYIEIQKKLDKIEILVKNPFHPSLQTLKGNHMALENIRQRLALIYDLEAKLHYSVVNSGGNSVFNTGLNSKTGTKTDVNADQNFVVKMHFPF